MHRLTSELFRESNIFESLSPNAVSFTNTFLCSPIEQAVFCG